MSVWNVGVKFDPIKTSQSRMSGFLFRTHKNQWPLSKIRSRSSQACILSVAANAISYKLADLDLAWTGQQVSCCVQSADRCVERDSANAHFDEALNNRLSLGPDRGPGYRACSLCLPDDRAVRLVPFPDNNL